MCRPYGRDLLSTALIGQKVDPLVLTVLALVVAAVGWNPWSRNGAKPVGQVLQAAQFNVSQPESPAETHWCQPELRLTGGTSWRVVRQARQLTKDTAVNTPPSIIFRVRWRKSSTTVGSICLE